MSMVGEQGSWSDFVKARHKGPEAIEKRDPRSYSTQALVEFVNSLATHKEQRAVLVELMAKLQSEHEQARAQHAVRYPASGIWHLVNLTQKHWRYSASFNFPKDAPDWLHVPRQPPDVQRAPPIIAVDCEMCETVDSKRALLSVTAVDHGGCVVLDTLVRPSAQIVDLRSDITGITAAQLEGVTTTRDEAAQQLAALLHGGAVLVGHGVHHDMHALQLDYWPVIDTALLYAFDGMPDYTPSLTQLAQLVLGKTLRVEGQPHCAKDDAAAALQLAQRACTEGAVTTLPPTKLKADKKLIKQLLVHDIAPRIMRFEDLKVMIKDEFTLIGSLPGDSKVTLEFRSAMEADAAFNAFDGKRQKDSGGRLQKLVKCSLAGGEVKFRVRRMQAHSGAAIQVVKTSTPSKRAFSTMSRPNDGRGRAKQKTKA